MKKNIALIALIFVYGLTFAQVKDPVHWTFSAKKINATTYEVHMAASIESGWHTYSQTTPEGGPVPTSISFTKNPLLTLEGKTKEIGKLEQHNEPLFGVDVKQFSNKVDFVQIVKLRAAAKTNVSGSIEFMVCNDRECLPPKTVKFTTILE